MLSRQMLSRGLQRYYGYSGRYRKYWKNVELANDREYCFLLSDAQKITQEIGVI